MTKVLKKLGSKGTYLKVIKTISKELVSYIAPNGKKLKSFSLKSGVSQAYAMLHTYLIHCFHSYLEQ
jgi:hypothetical protein